MRKVADTDVGKVIIDATNRKLKATMQMGSHNANESVTMHSVEGIFYMTAGVLIEDSLGLQRVPFYHVAELIENGSLTFFE